MTANAIQGFWAKVDGDDALARDVDALFTGEKNAASAQAVVDLAARHGFAFTTDELKAHLVGAAGRELTDAELEGAAGGWVAGLRMPKVETTAFKIEIEGARFRTIHF